MVLENTFFVLHECFVNQEAALNGDGTDYISLTALPTSQGQNSLISYTLVKPIAIVEEYRFTLFLKIEAIYLNKYRLRSYSKQLRCVFFTYMGFRIPEQIKSMIS